MAGKDLDFFMVVKFLVFSMPRIVPLVLPLSVLLASIMTFGSLSENYEFAAMKSSGISLQRAMRSLTVFIFILSIVAFIFANNVIPYAEYKFINFRRNIAQVKPAMAIAEGQFSEIGNYTIKVAKKSGENGNLLSDIIIHIKSSTGEGNKTIIRAKSGELVSSENSNTLKLLLFDGNYYEDIYPKKYEERQRMPFAKATFKRDVINIDLSKLSTNTDTGEITNTNTMLNISELKYTIDSLNTNFKKDIKSYAENIYQRINTNSFVLNPKQLNNFSNIENQLNSLPLEQKIQTYNIAKNAAEGTIFSIDSSKFEMDEKQKNINSHWIALYDKFVIAFACLLMFFIGAPLGAIIRKGGLGLPIVFAVGIFIIFHFINTFGKKVAQENGITPFMGTWMSSIVLSPLAIILTYRATNDIGGMFNFDGIFMPIKKLFARKKLKDEVDEEDEDVIQSETVFDTNQIASTETIQPLLVSYNKTSKIALLLNVLGIVSFFIAKNNTSKIVLILLFVALVIALIRYVYISQKEINKIFALHSRHIEPGIEVAVVVALPFYFLIYLYNNNQLKELLSTKR